MKKIAWTVVEILAIIALFACIFVLSGCSHPRVAVPVRPAMPLESVEEGVPIDTFTAACIAEIARREAYEIQLLSALAICNGETRHDED